MTAAAERRTPAWVRAATWVAAAATAVAALTLLGLVAWSTRAPGAALAAFRSAVAVARTLGLLLAGAAGLVVLIHPATPLHLLAMARRLRARFRLHTAAYVDTLHQLRRTPNAPDLLTLARMHQDAGQHVDAVQALLAARTLDPTLLAVRYALGRSLLQLRRPMAAADELARVLAVDPGHDGGRVALHMAAALLALDQADAALALVQRHETTAGASATAAWLRARSLWTLGRRDEALAACRAALSAPRPDPDAALAAARARWHLWTSPWGRP